MSNPSAVSVPTENTVTFLHTWETWHPVTMPTAGASPTAMAQAADGFLWVVERGTKKRARITPF